MRFFVLVIACWSVIGLIAPCAQEIPAFPGAEGGGMFTTGGRGGTVYYVNTLEDHGRGDPELREGSLRWCLDQEGPKMVLFKIGGTIWLKNTLHIEKGDLTIAGQSAPGDGVTIAGFPVLLRADNVIVRFLRFRMGDLVIPEEKADAADAFGGGKNQDIIIDHCSISWGIDECSSFYDNRNFTMQWCIISESLRLSGHSKGPHGYGAIWGGVQATFHHNLLAHHDSRAPRLGPGSKYAGKDTTDMRNNVIYNWNGNGAYGAEAMHINIVNNYYKAGPATENRVKNRIVALNAKTTERPFPSIKDTWGKYYVDGNVLTASESLSRNNWDAVHIVGDQKEENIRLDSEVRVKGKIYTHDAYTAYQKVLAYAGSSLIRDAVDHRILEETASGTARFQGRSAHNGKGGKWKSNNYPRSGIIDSQQDTNPQSNGDPKGVWPVLEAGVAPYDENRDGVPDEWLEKYYPGKEATDNDEDGYTYLERYLNSLVAHITEGQI